MSFDMSIVDYTDGTQEFVVETQDSSGESMVSISLESREDYLQLINDLQLMVDSLTVRMEEL